MSVLAFALLDLQPAPAPATPPRPIEPGAWMNMGDYPAPAARSGTTGTVGVRLAVDERGLVTGCEITLSAGPVLDQATCRLLAERARFEPARDSAGAPVRSAHSTRIEWQLPGVDEPGPVPFAPSRVLVSTFRPTRGPEYCRVEIRGEAPAVLRTFVCAPGTNRGARPWGSGYFAWTMATLLPAGQRPGFSTSPPGRSAVLRRIRFEVDASRVVIRCEPVGGSSRDRAAAGDCADLRAYGRPVFLPAEPGSAPRRGELRVHFSIGGQSTPGRR